MKLPNSLKALSKNGRRFLELLLLPSPILKPGTSGEHHKTPYCHHSIKSSSLVVVFSEDVRFSDCNGDSDNYDHSKWYELPHTLLIELLAQIRPGGQPTQIIGRWLKINNEDSAWGADCAEPYDTKSAEAVDVALLAELSKGKRTATLTITNMRDPQKNVHLSRTTGGL